MKAISRKIVYHTVVVVHLLILVGCDTNEEKQGGETLFRGNARIACDREIIELIGPQIEWFIARHSEARVRLDTSSADEAMRQLLSGNVRAAFIARDYLPQEDSLLRAYNVEQHKRFLIATDAVVFVVRGSSSFDTISQATLIRTLRGERTPLANLQWIVPDVTSSITAYLSTVVGPRLRIRGYVVPSGDSVLHTIARGEGDIGIALLSQLQRKKKLLSLRPIRVVIQDSTTGDRVAIMPHVATIVKERYPFRVPIYGYLFESARNFPYGVVASLAFEAKPQRAMLDAGIVPAYAKLQLVEQE